jgi:lantibiotic biosynthesis protein
MCSEDTFLAAAASIGRRVVSDAVWHDGRCSWVGALADPALSRTPEYRALGPTLYGGTAGVGLFLAHLAVVTGEAPTRRTAVGALRHAVVRAQWLAGARRDGFHAGSAGIAWAAARAAGLLGDDELHAGARTVLNDTSALTGPDRCPDLVMGSAGSVIAHLELAAIFEEPRLIDDAVAAGDALIERATVTSHGWSWAIPGRRYSHHLCGVSHGAGGIGWALLELFAETGDDRFRAGASAAFDYERSWLDPSSGTWPDLRIGGQRRGAPRPIVSPAAGTWCHGEAGIALTRLRAMAVLGEGPHEHDAEVALEATRAHLAGALPYDIGDASLCHGAAGAADALLSGAELLGQRWHAAAELAAHLGQVVIERHASTGDDWPCGDGATTPGLFLGLSGIAWLFLRLHDQRIPSPLAPCSTVDSDPRRT